MKYFTRKFRQLRIPYRLIDSSDRLITIKLEDQPYIPYIHLDKLSEYLKRTNQLGELYYQLMQSTGGYSSSPQGDIREVFTWIRDGSGNNGITDRAGDSTIGSTGPTSTGTSSGWTNVPGSFGSLGEEFVTEVGTGDN